MRLFGSTVKSAASVIFLRNWEAFWTAKLPFGQGIVPLYHNKIFADQNNNMTRIRVIDNGSGIRKEDLPHIFEPFFTKKIVKKGIGLGLSICRGIIDKHEGTIKINSIYGRGTEVIVHLPN